MLLEHSLHGTTTFYSAMSKLAFGGTRLVLDGELVSGPSKIYGRGAEGRYDGVE